MIRMVLVVTATAFALAACKQDPPAPAKQEAPKAAPIPTEVTYTSMKDIKLDGDKAKGKRARVEGRIRDISNNFSLYAKGATGALWLYYTETEKPLLRKFNTGNRVIVEFLVEDPKATVEEMGRLLDVKKR